MAFLCDRVSPHPGPSSRLKQPIYQHVLLMRHIVAEVTPS